MSEGKPTGADQSTSNGGGGGGIMNGGGVGTADSVGGDKTPNNESEGIADISVDEEILSDGASGGSADSSAVAETVMTTVHSVGGDERVTNGSKGTTDNSGVRKLAVSGSSGDGVSSKGTADSGGGGEDGSGCRVTTVDGSGGEAVNSGGTGDNGRSGEVGNDGSCGKAADSSCTEIVCSLGQEGIRTDGSEGIAYCYGSGEADSGGGGGEIVTDAGSVKTAATDSSGGEDTVNGDGCRSTTDTGESGETMISIGNGGTPNGKERETVNGCDSRRTANGSGGTEESNKGTGDHEKTAESREIVNDGGRGTANSGEEIVNSSGIAADSCAEVIDGGEGKYKNHGVNANDNKSGRKADGSSTTSMETVKIGKYHNI